MNLKKNKGPLLIAEIGGNHEGNFNYAVKLTKQAIESKVDVIKFQFYTGDTLVSEIENPKRNSHFKKFELSVDQHIYLAEMIREANIMYSSSVWTTDALSWIDKYIDIYKIGSGDLTAIPIINEICKLKKPVIVSSGLSSFRDVTQTINLIKSKKFYKSKNLALLQCTSMYPINFSDVNLKVMMKYKEKFNIPVGYSDHTVGIKALKYAYSCGAEILEFHFTDNKKNRNFRDHKVSLTKSDISDLKNEIEIIDSLMGSDNKTPLKIEIENGHDVSFRRAVYPSKDIKKNEKLDENNLTVLRPNHGIDARDYYKLIGKKAKRDLKKHGKISFNDVY